MFSPWTTAEQIFSFQSFSGNVTKEQGSVKEEKGQGKDSRAHYHLEKKRRLSELEPSLQNKVAAAFSHTEVREIMLRCTKVSTHTHTQM